MSTPTFEWQDPDKLMAEVRRMLRDRAVRIRAIPERAVRRGTFELLRILQNQEETPKVTGTLVRSLHAEVQQLGQDLIEGKVGTWLPYARYLEEGTGVFGPLKREIQVVAKNKKGLFWGAFDNDGNPIVRKKVLIQGIKPRHYFATAIAKFLPRYLEIIREEIAEAAA